MAKSASPTPENQQPADQSPDAGQSDFDPEDVLIDCKTCLDIICILADSDPENDQLRQCKAIALVASDCADRTLMCKRTTKVYADMLAHCRLVLMALFKLSVDGSGVASSHVCTIADLAAGAATRALASE